MGTYYPPQQPNQPYPSQPYYPPYGGVAPNYPPQQTMRQQPSSFYSTSPYPQQPPTN